MFILKTRRLRDSTQGGIGVYAHAHPGKNEPFWFLFYIYLFANKKPKFDPVFVFCHFCLHPLQNAMKTKKIRKIHPKELQPFFSFPYNDFLYVFLSFFSFSFYPQTRHDMFRPCHRFCAWGHLSMMDCAVPVPGRTR